MSVPPRCDKPNASTPLKAIEALPTLLPGMKWAATLVHGENWRVFQPIENLEANQLFNLYQSPRPDRETWSAIMDGDYIGRPPCRSAKEQAPNFPLLVRWLWFQGSGYRPFWVLG